MPDELDLEVRQLETRGWNDLVKLFGKTGADGGCWCMYWRLSQKEYSAGDRWRNKRLLKSLIEDDKPIGLMAYLGDEPVGWCGLSPRKDFERLERSRVFKRVDDKPVWSLVCFFIHSEHQRKGIATALLSSAVEFVSKQDAPALESYPILEWGPKVTRSTAFTGTVEMFERAGFHKVSATEARSGDQPRVIMRHDLLSKS